MTHYKVFSIILLTLSFALISCGDIQGVEGTKSTQSDPIPEDLMNFRYCEAIPVFAKGTNAKAEVFNTIGHNQCPTDLWEALDVDALKEEFGAAEIILNGPRFFTVNAGKVEMQNTNSEFKVANFGGLEMKYVADIEFKLWNKPELSDAYQRNKVLRNNTWIFFQGTRVYELMDDEENVYIMQSYSQIVDQTQTLEDLVNLDSRLNLPEGWSFRTRVLEEEFQLAAGGEAIVLTDDLSNTYQMVR